MEEKQIVKHRNSNDNDEQYEFLPPFSPKRFLRKSIDTSKNLHFDFSLDPSENHDERPKLYMYATKLIWDASDFSYFRQCF